MRKIIGFHNPDEEYGFLSNWYRSDFTVDGIRYCMVEQFMMHSKAKVFQDPRAAAEIMKTSDAGKIKALGRGVRNYDETIWNGMRQVIVYRGLLEKFKQNDELRRKLLDTGSAVLAECAVQDKIWGIGLGVHDDRRNRMTEWRGKNLLGFALMLARDELKQ